MKFLRSIFCFLLGLFLVSFSFAAMLVKETKEETVKATLKPVEKQAIIASYDVPKPSVKQVHASTIVEVSPDLLLCAWYGGDADGKPNVKIWSAFFDCKNNKWSEPKVIANSEEIDGITEAMEKEAIEKVKNDPKKKPEVTRTACWDPVLFQVPNEEVFLFYKLGIKPTDWTGYFKISQDKGKTWSTVKMLPPGVFGPAKNKPICIPQTDTAYSLVCGSSSESWNRAWGCWIDILTFAGGQKIWQGVGPIYFEDTNLKDPEGIIQPTLFWDADKNLRMLCRSKNIGKLCTAFSKDNGNTWSNVEKTVLNSNNSSVEAINLKDGRILLAYSDINEKEVPRENRYRLDLAISDDGGKTWKNVYELENLEKQDKKKQICYPSVIQASDGKIHITYTYGREKIKHVILDPKFLK